MTRRDFSKLAEKYAGHPEFLGTTIRHPDQRGAFDNTLLHVAAEKGDAEDVAALIRAGADVNAKGDLGNTPLHGAALMGRLAAARLLVEAGAGLRSRNEQGQTPLQVAETGRKGEVAAFLRGATRG